MAANSFNIKENTKVYDAKLNGFTVYILYSMQRFNLLRAYLVQNGSYLYKNHASTITCLHVIKKHKDTIFQYIKNCNIIAKTLTDHHCITEHGNIA